MTVVALLAAGGLAGCGSIPPESADELDLADKLERLESGFELQDSDVITSCMKYRGFDSADTPTTDTGDAEVDAFWRALSNDDDLETLTQEERRSIADQALGGDFSSDLGCQEVASFVRELKLTDELGTGPELARQVPSEDELLADPIFLAIVDRFEACMREEGFEGIRTDDDLSLAIDEYYEADAKRHPVATTTEPDGKVSLGDGFLEPHEQPESVGELLAANESCQELIADEAQARVLEMIEAEN